MSTYAFETTVLSAFALVRRLDLLEARYGDRATWTVEVHREISDGLAEHPQLGDVLVAEWLGEPVRVYAVDQIERVRLALGGKARPGDRRHLGEAATIALALREGYVVAIDDYDGTRYARARGIGTINTVAILRGCVRDGQLSASTAKGLRDEMVETYDRRLPDVTEDDLAP